MAGSDLSPNAKFAYDYFTKAGVPAPVAAGLVGNLMQESGPDLNPAAIGDNGNAFGVGQWNGPRMRAYVDFAQKAGKPVDDLQTQLDFAMSEANSGEGAAWSKMWGAKTPEDAALLASQHYERPGVPNNSARVQNARKVYDLMNVADVATPPPVNDNPADDNLKWLESMAPQDKPAEQPASDTANDPNIDWLESMAPKAKEEAPKEGDLPDTSLGGIVKKLATGAADRAVENFGSGPLLDTNFWQSSPDAPGYSKALDTAANYSIGPVLSLAGRAGNALTGAIEGGLKAGGDMIDPSGALGNDAAALVTYAPLDPVMNMTIARNTAIRDSGVNRLTQPADGPAIPPPAEAPAGAIRAEPPLTRANMQTPSEAAPMASANAGEASNLSAAATPKALSVVSPKEAAAIEAGDALKRFAKSGKTEQQTPDIYVPGSTPLAAEYGTVEDANRHRSLMAKDEAYRTATTEKLNANNEARVQYYGEQMGSPESVASEKSVINQEFETALDDMMSKKQPTDPTPVVDTINGMLQGRIGQQDGPRTVLNSILNKIAPDGKPVTDPDILYGIRQDINNKLDKAGRAADPSIAHSERPLMQVKTVLDQVIDQGAPGFSDLMKQYSERVAPLDAAEYLQDKFPSIMKQGQMSPNAFRNLMVDIYKQRKAGGIGPATKLSPDQLAALWNIDSDLQRTNRLSAGMGLGSNTQQIGHTLLAMGGEAALHGVASLAGPFGNVAAAAGKAMWKNSKLAAERNRLLAPPPKE